jgi:hypothetical protein
MRYENAFIKYKASGGKSQSGEWAVPGMKKGKRKKRGRMAAHAWSGVRKGVVIRVTEC